MTVVFPYQVFSSTVILILLGCLRDADACDMPIGYTRPNTVGRILRATYVLYGRIQRTFKDPQFDYSDSDVYTAQMEVYCVLKGRTVPHIFNISQAGEVPGHCTSTEFIAGQEYFVLLNNNKLPHGLDFAEINATEENIVEVTKACGLMPLYPHGVTETTAKKACPRVASPGECLSETKVTHNNDTSSYDGFQLAVRNDRNSQPRSQYSPLLLTSLLIVLVLRILDCNGRITELMRTV